MKKLFRIIFKISIVIFISVVTIFYLIREQNQNEERENVKWAFEYVTSLKFPEEVKLYFTHCSMGYSGGGFTCEAIFKVTMHDYRTIKQRIDNNASIANYHQNAKEWHIELCDKSHIVSFQFIDN